MKILSIIVIAFFYTGCGLVGDEVQSNDNVELRRHNSTITTFQTGTRIQDFPNAEVLATRVPALSFRFEWLDAKPAREASGWFSTTFAQPDRRSFSLGSTELQIQMADNICNGNYRIWVFAAIDTLIDSLAFDFIITGGEDCETVDQLDSADLIWSGTTQDGYVYLASNAIRETVTGTADFRISYSGQLQSYLMTHPGVDRQGWESLVSGNTTELLTSNDEYNFYSIPPAMPLKSSLDLYNIGETLSAARENQSSPYIELKTGQAWIYRDRQKMLGFKVIEADNRLVLRVFRY